MTKSYSKVFKNEIIAKALLPEGPSVLQLSQELSLSKSTIYKWIRKSNGCRKMTKSKNDNDSSSNINKWSDEKKFQAVFKTMNYTDQEISEYCRTNGIYRKDLISWKKKMIEGLSTHKKAIDRKELQKSKAKTKELEKDLRKKDKALAEVSALLILKKKVMKLFEEE